MGPMGESKWGMCLRGRDICLVVAGSGIYFSRLTIIMDSNSLLGPRE